LWSTIGHEELSTGSTRTNPAFSTLSTILDPIRESYPESDRSTLLAVDERKMSAPGGDKALFAGAVRESPLGLR